MLAPSSGVCQLGQCFPPSHDATGDQSQSAVTTQVSPPPSSACAMPGCMITLLFTSPLAEIIWSSVPFTMNIPWSEPKATLFPKSMLICWKSCDVRSTTWPVRRHVRRTKYGSHFPLVQPPMLRDAPTPDEWYIQPRRSIAVW